MSVFCPVHRAKPAHGPRAKPRADGAVPHHQAYQAVVGILVVQADRANTEIDAVQRFGGRGIQPALGADAVAEGLPISDRRDRVGHRVERFEQPADDPGRGGCL